MAYVIVNAFLDNVTFESTEAERLIKQVILRTGEVLPHINEVFRPIFSTTQTVSMTERGGNPEIPASISSTGET